MNPYYVNKAKQDQVDAGEELMTQNWSNMETVAEWLTDSVNHLYFANEDLKAYRLANAGAIASLESRYAGEITDKDQDKLDAAKTANEDAKYTPQTDVELEQARV